MLTDDTWNLARPRTTSGGHSTCKSSSNFANASVSIFAAPGGVVAMSWVRIAPRPRPGPAL